MNRVTSLDPVYGRSTGIGLCINARIAATPCGMRVRRKRDHTVSSSAKVTAAMVQCGNIAQLVLPAVASVFPRRKRSRGPIAPMPKKPGNGLPQ